MKRDVLVKANELGAKMVPMGQATTRWGMVYRWHGELYSSIHSNTACHAGLNNPFNCSCGNRYEYNARHTKDCAYGHSKGAEILAVVSMLWTDVPKPMAVAFLNWLFNKSQYSPAFQNRSGKVALTKGYCIAEPGANANIMAGGLVASRRLWEYTTVVHVWSALVERGVHPSLAFWLGHKSSGRDGRQGDMHMRAELAGHTSITTGSTSWVGLRSFLDGTQLPCRKKEIRSFAECRNYGSYSSMLKEVRGEAAGGPSVMVQNMSYDANVQAEAKLNPFKKWVGILARRKGGGDNKTLPFARCMDRVAKTLAPKMMEKIYA